MMMNDVSVYILLLLILAVALTFLAFVLLAVSTWEAAREAWRRYRTTSNEDQERLRCTCSNTCSNTHDRRLLRACYILRDEVNLLRDLINVKDKHREKAGDGDLTPRMLELAAEIERLREERDALLSKKR